MSSEARHATRPPAVAGTFYPAPASVLARDLRRLLAHAPATPTAPAKAIIAPHAGYVYSGPIAATAGRHAMPSRDTTERLIYGHEFAGRFTQDSPVLPPFMKTDEGKDLFLAHH